MNKRLKPFIAKFLCGILSLPAFLSNLPTYFAETNVSKINSLLQDIYTDDSGKKEKEKYVIDDIYHRLKLAREHNYSGHICSGHQIIDSSSGKKDVFTKIYDSNFWGSGESKSGPGSQIDSTRNICEALPKIFEKYNIKSMLDAPCGDYNWMKTVDKKGINYLGGDIVPKIIRENNKKFKDESTSFKVMDITSDEIPKVDMIFCRDCLQHLSYKNVKKALKNFKDSGSTYLLVTNYLWTLENYDIKDGDFRALNLCQSPFNLFSYVEKIKESDADGNCPDKYLYLYKLNDIDIDKMFARKKVPSNIPIAMALDENYVCPTVVSMTSIMENSNYRSTYDFYIMHSPDLSDDSKKILNSLQEKYDNCRVKLIDMKDKYNAAHTDSRITTPAYYRLLLSELLPDIDKIIYIDGDTIVYEDLVDMINIDMDGYCYKGFLDLPSTMPETLKQFGISSDHYICDGVMLVNLAELRKDDAVKKFDDFITRNNDKLIQHDQTVINAVFVDKIGVLPAKYGVWNRFFSLEEAKKMSDILASPEKYTPQELLNARSNPAILHFVYKPWNMAYISEYSDIWWHHAEQTDILDKIQQKYSVSNGTYKIISKLDANKVLDISGASVNQGAKLQLWENNNTDAQKFRVTYDKDGYYTIKAVCSGKVIDVPYASNTMSTALWQYERNDTSAQKWRIFSNKDGSYKLISKCNGMVMDVREANTKNGSPIQCYASNNTDAQSFRFIKLD